MPGCQHARVPGCQGPRWVGGPGAWPGLWLPQTWTGLSPLSVWPEEEPAAGLGPSADSTAAACTSSRPEPSRQPQVRAAGPLAPAPPPQAWCVGLSEVPRSRRPGMPSLPKAWPCLSTQPKLPGSTTCLRRALLQAVQAVDPSVLEQRLPSPAPSEFGVRRNGPWQSLGPPKATLRRKSRLAPSGTRAHRPAPGTWTLRPRGWGERTRRTPSRWSGCLSLDSAPAWLL